MAAALKNKIKQIIKFLQPPALQPTSIFIIDWLFSLTVRPQVNVFKCFVSSAQQWKPINQLIISVQSTGFI